MGSSFELKIGACSILESKSRVIPEVMSLFSPRERHYEWKKYSEVYPEDEIPESDDFDYAVCKYQSTLATAKRRLDILGFDLESTAADFESCRQAEIAEFEEWDIESDENSWTESIAVLKSSDLSSYIEAYREIFKEGVHPYYYKNKHPHPEGIIKFIVDADYDAPYMGFPCSDIRYFFRVFLEVVPDESLVVLDMSDLVNSGCYEFNEEVTDLAHQELTSDYPINARIIVLCEGASDRAILKRSMELLYPEFCNRYSFMDFHQSKAPGGASTLVQTVKAFMGAGIENRIIALFDNDTAAISARRALSGIQLPSHIKVKAYPAFGLLKSYPTIGPSGIQVLDVNGMAGSIELYLGRECLEVETGFSPVQWKGYVQDVGAYHGEVINKRAIQQRFYEKLEDCERDKNKLDNYDWEGIRLIVNSIFDSFCGAALAR